MSDTRLGAAVAAVLMVTAGLLTGCGSSEDDSPSGDTSSAQEKASESPTTEESSTAAEPKEPAAKAPAGMRMVTAEESGLRFAAPESWVILDKERLKKVDPKLLEKFASNMNVTGEQLVQMMAGVDVMVSDPSGASINVNQPGALGEIPPEAAIREQFGALNATVDEVEDVDTTVGSGRVVYYSLPTQPQVFGASLFVEITSGVTNLTVSMRSDAESRKLMDQILPTLADVG